MGALGGGHYNVELENGVNLGVFSELEFEKQPETKAIEDAVRVLLLGLGEDISREGLRKTPFRVAKALREGTRGQFSMVCTHLCYGFLSSLPQILSLIFCPLFVFMDKGWKLLWFCTFLLIRHFIVLSFTSFGTIRVMVSCPVLEAECGLT